MEELKIEFELGSATRAQVLEALNATIRAMGEQKQIKGWSIQTPDYENPEEIIPSWKVVAGRVDPP